MILQFPLKQRKPFSNPQIPWHLYPFCAISKWSDSNRFLNLLWKSFFYFGRNRQGSFQWLDKTISFRAGNSQFQSIYFDHFCKDGYEPEVCALLDLLTNETSVFFDIGANFGYHSLYLASKAHFSGQIFAFEPFPKTYCDLVSVVSCCGLEKQIHCLPIAASNTSQTLHMKIPGLFKASSGLAQISPHPTHTAVRAEPLDSLHLPDPTVIKLDVEGFETEVLSGAAQLFERAKPMLIFENFSDPKPLEILTSWNYKLFRPIYLNNILTLTPFSVKERPRFAEANLFACHEEKFISEIEKL